jgi:acyl carrier protein
MRSDAALVAQVRTVIAESLDLDEDQLPDEPSQDTVARWSSLAHLVLVLNLEERFGVSFSMDEMVTLTSARRIVEVLSQRA